MGVASTAMLFGILTAILLAVGWVIGGFLGMLIFLVFAAIINLVSYWYSDKLVLKIYRAQPLEDPEIERMIEDICKGHNIPKPRLYKVKTDVPNAFATGRSPKHSAVAVTEGLMNLEREEMRGVLAHELSHIKNRDVLVSSVAATIAGAIAYIAHIGYWSMLFGGGRRGEGNLLGVILVIIFAPLAALLVRLAISRSREYKADVTGALMTKRPKALASALRKISSSTRENPIHGSSATSSLWIVNPFKEDWFTNLFSTHPPVERRIEKLETMDITD